MYIKTKDIRRKIINIDLHYVEKSKIMQKISKNFTKTDIQTTSQHTNDYD